MIPTFCAAIERRSQAPVIREPPIEWNPLEESRIMARLPPCLKRKSKPPADAHCAAGIERMKPSISGLDTSKTPY